jgi:hypothetical protein
MGFLGNVLGGDAVMSGDAFFFTDSDQVKLKICREAGERMAPAIGGAVKIRDGGDEVHVTGQFGQYRVRVIIWVTFANLRIQIKPRQKLPIELFGGLRLTYDGEATKHAGEQLDRDEWDKDSDQKLFLSPHVYMEGDRDELRQAKTLYEQLPAELMTQLLQLMESAQKDATSLSICNEEAAFYFNDSKITLSRSAANHLAQVLQLLTSIIAAAEQNWGGGRPPAAPQPSPPHVPPSPIGGPPMGGAFGAAPPVIGPGSVVLVAWADGNRYPATVVQAAQGQYLCAFQNGQQHWIPAMYVAPSR